VRKFLCCWMIGVCLIGCAGNRQAAPPDSQLAKVQRTSVYFHGEGSDRDVRRFQKFLEIALEDYDMVLTDASRNADATVKVGIKREDGSGYLYTQLLWITLVSHDGQQFVSKSCGTVSTSNSIFKEPITYVPIEFPVNWEKEHPHFAIYMNDTDLKRFEGLLPGLKKALADKNYRLVKSRAEADGELKKLQIQKLAIPMVTRNLDIDYEVLDKDFNRVSYTSGKGLTSVVYAGAQPAIKLESIPCRLTIETFSVGASDGFWDKAHRIAGEIQEHIRKTETHSN
jgi:hypothetical protein